MISLSQWLVFVVVLLGQTALLQAFVPDPLRLWQHHCPYDVFKLRHLQARSPSR